jgi:methyl-accepting chemotaxis protein
MPPKISTFGKKLFLSNFVLLISVFGLITVFGLFGLSRINQSLLKDTLQKQSILGMLKDLRIAFSDEHNSITYGLSKDFNQSRSYYEDAEKRIQHSFDGLKQLLTEKNGLMQFNVLVYNQTMFSEQIKLLFNSIVSRQNQSLTYDELTDLKSYALRTLNEANVYAGNFDAALNQIENDVTGSYYRNMALIISSLQKVKIIFLLLIGVLVAVSLFFSYIFASRATTPFTRASAMIRELAAKKFTGSIDYSSIDNSDIADILRIFSTNASMFRNFILQNTESLRSMAGTIRAGTSRIEMIRSAANSEKDQTGTSTSHMLEYAQDFENVRFYFDKIRDLLQALKQEKNTLYEGLSSMLTRSGNVIENHNKLANHLSAFNESAEKINVLALNLNVEASKPGDGTKDLNTTVHEISKLILQSLESAKGLNKVMVDNKNVILTLRDTFKIMQAKFSGLTARIEDVQTEYTHLEDIAGKGEQVRKDLDSMAAASDGLRQKTLGLLDEFQRANNDLASSLDRLAGESEQYRDLKEEANYIRINNTEEIAEKTVFDSRQ